MHVIDPKWLGETGKKKVVTLSHHQMEWISSAHIKFHKENMSKPMTMLISLTRSLKNL